MVSTRQSSNSSTNTDGSSILCCDKSYEAAAGPSGTSSSSSRRNQHSQSGMSHGGSAVSAAAAVTSDNTSYLNLLDLPVEVLQKIFSYLDYNSIARLRPVCHQMDKVCGSILNSAFQRLQTQMLSRFQAIKAQMPRRESARRNHPLACESDIIETLHMRLTLLQMSFGKHIERKHCCFFPGEILDEVNRILHYIKVTPKLARPYKVTDELFDLSTMAMEYFKDCIEPTLPEIPYFGAEFLDLAGTFSSPLSVPEGKGARNGGGGSGSGSSGEASPSCSGNDESGSNGLDNSGSISSAGNSSSVGGAAAAAAAAAAGASSPQSNMVLRKRIRKIKQGMKRYNSQLSLMRRDLRSCKAKIAEQQKQIVEYATRLDDNDKKNEETSRKFSTLLQVLTKELNKCKTELQYWRSKSPAIPVYFGCGGQSLPLPCADDFQSLANQQGILSNVEASVGESGLDFIPIADGAARSPCTEREIDCIMGMPTAQLPLASSSSAGCSSSSSSSTVTLESMAPPKAPPPLQPTTTTLVPTSLPSTSSLLSPPLVATAAAVVSTKRKSSTLTCSPEDDSSKKPRRVLKARQAKRSKI